MLRKFRLLFVGELYILLFLVSFMIVYYYRLDNDWYLVVALWLMFVIIFTFNKTIDLVNYWDYYGGIDIHE